MSGIHGSASLPKVANCGLQSRQVITSFRYTKKRITSSRFGRRRLDLAPRCSASIWLRSSNRRSRTRGAGWGESGSRTNVALIPDIVLQANESQELGGFAWTEAGGWVHLVPLPGRLSSQNLSTPIDFGSKGITRNNRYELTFAITRHMTLTISPGASGKHGESEKENSIIGQTYHFP